MKIFRCRICSDVYLGYKQPTNCPFCGAHGRFIIQGIEWTDENDVALSNISRKNLEEALNIEIANAHFYRCAADTAVSPVLAGMFKALSKIEAEHASIHAKILKLEAYDDIYHSNVCSPEDGKNIEESLRREENAVMRYEKFAQEAVEPRIKEVFLALAEIEKDHIALDKMMAEKLSGSN